MLIRLGGWDGGMGPGFFVVIIIIIILIIIIIGRNGEKGAVVCLVSKGMPGEFVM